MDLEAIPGLSDELNSEVCSMNEEFCSHQSEQSSCEQAGDDDTAEGAIASSDLDKSVEDREEETVVHEYFDGSPCCTLGPNKSACWTRAGRERFLLARQESLDLEKKDLDLVVLGTLRASCTFSSTSREVVRASSKYHYGDMPICFFVHSCNWCSEIKESD